MGLLLRVVLWFTFLLIRYLIWHFNKKSYLLRLCDIEQSFAAGVDVGIEVLVQKQHMRPDALHGNDQRL